MDEYNYDENSNEKKKEENRFAPNEIEEPSFREEPREHQQPSSQPSPPPEPQWREEMPVEEPAREEHPASVDEIREEPAAAPVAEEPQWREERPIAEERPLVEETREEPAVQFPEEPQWRGERTVAEERPVEEPSPKIEEPRIHGPETRIEEPLHMEDNIQRPRTRTSTDEELEGYLAMQKATIKVIGTGGGGNNTIDRIKTVGIDGVEIIAINTDAQDLLFTNADKKILIGRDVTKGLGAGSDPKRGEEAAKEDEHELKQTMEGSDMIFITCGLGGGTGTGSAPVIAEIGKKLGCLTVGVVTIPFTMEGNRRYQNAIDGLERLEAVLDTLIVIPNDKLLELAPELPINTAFKVSDEILTNAVKGIAELVTKAGLVNLDFADIRAVMGNGGVALIGVGESDTENRAIEAVEKAINNPLLDADISGATGALINVAGGTDMTLDEARKVVEAVSERLNPDAVVIWGAQIYEDLQSTIRTMLIVTGVQSAQIFGKARTLSSTRKATIGNELGIDFVG